MPQLIREDFWQIEIGAEILYLKQGVVKDFVSHKENNILVTKSHSLIPYQVYIGTLKFAESGTQREIIECLANNMPDVERLFEPMEQEKLRQHYIKVFARVWKVCEAFYGLQKEDDLAKLARMILDGDTISCDIARDILRI